MNGGQATRGQRKTMIVDEIRTGRTHAEIKWTAEDRETLG